MKNCGNGRLYSTRQKKAGDIDFPMHFIEQKSELSEGKCGIF